MPERFPESDLDDALAVVADETRIAIVRALWEAHVEDPEAIDGPRGTPLSFSTLRERVGVADSGRFNYHLERLVPRFVRKRADGYVLTDAGARVVGAAVSGVYTDSDTTLGETTMGPCGDADCEGALEATYENGHVVVACGDCSRETTLPAPPVVLQTRDAETDAEVLRRYAMTNVHRMIRGFCLLCDGPVRARLDRSSSADESGPVGVVHECRECGNVGHTTATICLLDHPAVISFLHDAGVDYRTVALWRMPETIDAEETLSDDDPARVTVEITAPETSLRVRADDSLTVLDYARRTDATPGTSG